jgi:hypothetical protein
MNKHVKIKNFLPIYYVSSIYRIRAFRKEKYEKPYNGAYQQNQWCV